MYWSQEARAEAAKRTQADNEVEVLRAHLQQYTIEANESMVQYQQQISKLEEKMQRYVIPISTTLVSDLVMAVRPTQRL